MPRQWEAWERSPNFLISHISRVDTPAHAGLGMLLAESCNHETGQGLQGPPHERLLLKSCCCLPQWAPGACTSPVSLSPGCCRLIIPKNQGSGRLWHLWLHTCSPWLLPHCFPHLVYQFFLQRLCFPDHIHTDPNFPMSQRGALAEPTLAQCCPHSVSVRLGQLEGSHRPPGTAGRFASCSRIVTVAMTEASLDKFPFLSHYRDLWPSPPKTASQEDDLVIQAAEVERAC